MDEQQEISVFARITEIALALLGSRPNAIDNDRDLKPCLRSKNKTKRYWEWNKTNPQQLKKTVHWSPSLEEVVVFQCEKREKERAPKLTRNCLSRQGKNSPLQKDIHRLLNLKKPLFTSSSDSFEQAENRVYIADSYIDDSYNDFPESEVICNDLKNNILDVTQPSTYEDNVETIIRPDGGEFVVLRVDSYPNKPWDFEDEPEIWETGAS